MKTIIFIFSILLCQQIKAQNSIIRYDNFGYVKSVEFLDTADGNAPNSVDEFFQRFVTTDNSDIFRLADNTQTEKSVKTYKQYYSDIPVDGGGFTFHYNRDGYLCYVHGHYVNTNNIDANNIISKESARDAYALFLNMKLPYIEDYVAELIIKEKDSIPFLLYKVFFPMSNNLNYGYVDALSGKILFEESSLTCISAIGTFNTRYNGTQTATTNYDNDSFSLLDTSRGATIHTKNLNNGTPDYNPSYEIIDNDNFWQRTEFTDSTYMALDIHWALQKIYDRLFIDYGKNSYNNQGKSIDAYVNVLLPSSGNTYTSDNAAWNSYYQSLYFGSGGTTFSPLASLDVVAHEYGHGITNYMIGWSINENYLNEGLSDIWAAILENKICPQYSPWTIGEQVTKTHYCLRNLAVPDSSNAKIQMASTYNSPLYNNGDYYVKSGVFSHWFYLLATGGHDYNDNGDYYSFNGIGINKAEELIVKAVYSEYFRYQSSFSDIRTATINAAKNLTYLNIEEVVAYAWYAVGVGTSPWSISGSDSFCNSESYTISSNATIQWHTSNSNIAVVSGQGTNSVTLQNNGTYCKFTLYADIYVSGSLVTTISKEITAGIPSMLGMDVLPVHLVGSTPVNGWVENSTGNGIIIEEIDPSNYTFLEATLTNITNLSNPVQVAHYTNLIPTSSFINIPASCGSGFYQLKVRGTNGCGNTLWSTVIIEVGGNGGGFMELLLNYDAATETVSVAMPEKSMAELSDVQLWSSSSLVRSYNFSGQRSCLISVADLRKGLYMIRAEADGKVYIGKFLK